MYRRLSSPIHTIIYFNKRSLNMEKKIDLENEIPMREVGKPGRKPKAIVEEPQEAIETPINCLRNERIIVRHINTPKGNITNPKHVLYGGMAESATRTFVVPRLSSGQYVNVLTDNEKACLEEIMGLEHNALSIYKKIDNFWNDDNPHGVNRVKLNKQDNYLDLSSPEDYIRYKILLANKDFICPSLDDLERMPKATYQFVIVSEATEAAHTKSKMSTTMQCYKEYGKVEDDKEVLSYIVETAEGRPVAANTKIEFLQAKCNDIIQSNMRLFLSIIQDPYRDTKVLIRKAVQAGIISKRGTYYYLREDGTPLCEDNQDPTLDIAAKFLSAPKRQELKFSIEAKI